MNEKNGEESRREREREREWRRAQWNTGDSEEGGGGRNGEGGKEIWP